LDGGEIWSIKADIKASSGVLAKEIWIIVLLESYMKKLLAPELYDMFISLMNSN
jgi:hypothetical protein